MPARWALKLSMGRDVEEENGMKHNVTTDRRRDQRVQARLQIELQMEPGGQSHASDTINISSNGVYFISPRFIAPLTKLGLRLLLPDEEKGGEVPVDCTGIVVRVLPGRATAGVDRYEVACYFTDTSPEFQERLGHYVQKHL
jgi:PilZ domain